MGHPAGYARLLSSPHRRRSAHGARAGGSRAAPRKRSPSRVNRSNRCFATTARARIGSRSSPAPQRRRARRAAVVGRAHRSAQAHLRRLRGREGRSLRRAPRAAAGAALKADLRGRLLHEMHAARAPISSTIWSRIRSRRRTSLPIDPRPSRSSELPYRADVPWRGCIVRGRRRGR